MYIYYQIKFLKIYTNKSNLKKFDSTYILSLDTHLIAYYVDSSFIIAILSCQQTKWPNKWAKKYFWLFHELMWDLFQVCGDELPDTFISKTSVAWLTYFMTGPSSSVSSEQKPHSILIRYSPYTSGLLNNIVPLQIMSLWADI